MTVTEFLAEMDSSYYPHEKGPWIEFDCYDPPFKRQELRQMRKLDVIELDEPNKRFRLTLQATELAEAA